MIEKDPSCEHQRKSFFRLRNWFIWLAPLLILITLFRTDPDAGAASTLIYLMKLASGFFIATALAHLGRRFLHDYPEADLRSTMALARENPIGAGLLAVAQAITLFGLLMVASTAAKAQDVRSYVPANCLTNLQFLKQAQKAHWPGHPDRGATIAALGEHESCVSLKSSRCCSPGAQLKTQREEGAGIPQLTRAFRADGSLRFDALQEMRDKHPALQELSWDTIYKRPDLQNAVLVLKSRDNFEFFKRLGIEDDAALDFADGGYNAGNGRMQSDRRVCGLVAGCDPRKWFGNVEMHCTASRAALYGDRSACDIYHHHVTDVRITRRTKYVRLMT